MAPYPPWICDWDLGRYKAMAPSTPSTPALAQVGKEKNGQKSSQTQISYYRRVSFYRVSGSAVARVKIQDVNLFQRIIEWLMNIVIMSNL